MPNVFTDVSVPFGVVLLGLLLLLMMGGFLTWKAHRTITALEQQINPVYKANAALTEEIQRRRHRQITLEHSRIAKSVRDVQKRLHEACTLVCINGDEGVTPETLNVWSLNWAMQIKDQAINLFNVYYDEEIRTSLRILVEAVSGLQSYEAATADRFAQCFLSIESYKEPTFLLRALRKNEQVSSLSILVPTEWDLADALGFYADGLEEWHSTFLQAFDRTEVYLGMIRHELELLHKRGVQI